MAKCHSRKVKLIELWRAKNATATEIHGIERNKKGMGLSASTALSNVPTHPIAE